jgi:hypothetical protein
VNVLEVGVGGISPPVFVGRRGDSPTVRDSRLYDPPTATNASRSRIRQPRRPNTSDSVSPRKSPSPFPNERSHHQSYQSASAVNPHAQCEDDITVTSFEFTPQASLLSPHHLPQSALPSLTRSRTPDPPTSDNLAIPADHVTLARCATAPAVESFADVLAANANDPATRHIARATKITRMEFSVKETWQPSPAPIIVSASSSSPRSGSEQKSRFGIRSFFKRKL